jgi:hypothetical protein
MEEGRYKHVLKDSGKVREKCEVALHLTNYHYVIKANEGVYVYS